MNLKTVLEENMTGGLCYVFARLFWLVTMQ